MKNFKRVSALLMALVLVFGLMPALVLAESSQSESTVATPAAGDNIIFAAKGAEADAVWAGAKGQLAAGEKFGIGWYGTCLHIIYAKQGVDAFKVNGKDAIVVEGDTYDIAVISYEDLEMEVTSGNGCYPLTLEVNGKTWEGFVCLDDLTAGRNNGTGSSLTGYQTVYSYDKAAGTQFNESYEMKGYTNDFDLAQNPTVVYDMKLSITSLPTQDPTGVAANVPALDGYCGLGLTLALGDPYTNSKSTLPAAYTAQRWSPIVFAKDADGKLYIAIWENNAVKYEYVDGIVLDDTTAHNLDVRVEFSHESATSNVTVLKVYVNGVLFLTSNNARCMTALGTSNAVDTFGFKRCVYTVDEALKLTFEAKQYVMTASADFELPVDPELELPNPDEGEDDGEDDGEEILPPAGMQAGDNVVFADKGAAGDDVWAAAKGQLAAGEKFGVAWYGTCLHIIYAKQGVDAFKVNDKDATVIKGDTYDIAVISYEDLGMEVTSGNGCYPLNLEVNGKTWDGFVILNDLSENTGTSSDVRDVTYTDEPVIDFGPYLYNTAGAIDIVANEPIVMEWDVNVKELPTSCDPDDITDWRGGYLTGYDYTWVKGITFMLCDPFAADVNSGVKSRWIPVSLLKDENGDLYVVYCEDNQFKNAKLEGVTLDAENGTDLHFRVELTYADAAIPAVALKCYVGDTFLFESANARNTAINVGSTPLADRFGMCLEANNYDVKSNDKAQWTGGTADAIASGALVLENIETIDFAMSNLTVKTLNAEFELPQDPAGGAPAPTGDTNEVALYAALLVTSILGMVALAIPTIRKKLF